MFRRINQTSPMQNCTYKGILDFLVKTSGTQAQGQYLRRLHVLTGLICSCINNKQCTVEALSDFDFDSGAEKNKESQIKQVKRTLNNKWIDWQLFYMPFAALILKYAARCGKLVFAIDGSQTGSKHTTLMVCLIFKGYAVPIAWIVKEGEKGHFPEDMHIEVMKLLSLCLPKDSQVMLLGDGEFDGARLHTFCLDSGWEFVCRTSKDRKIDCGGGEIVNFGSLSIEKGKQPLFIPDALPYAHGVYWHGKGYNDPIFLLTNIPLAREACRYYKLRFKIESMFKLLKSQGFQLHKTQLQSSQAICTLLIVVSIAYCFTYCMGCILKEDTPIARLKGIVRICKVKTMTYIFLAQQCLKKAPLLALEFFSNISKNLLWVFS